MRRDERVLDAALKIRAELPYACKGGVCSTCRAKVIDGQVEMARNYALEPDEVAAGYVLTCQASPVTDERHGRLRRVGFGTQLRPIRRRSAPNTASYDRH